MSPRSADIAVAPRSASYIDDAIGAGGGRLVEPSEASGLVWTHAQASQDLADLLDANPQIGWVQLPWAGVEAYLDVIDANRHRIWTNAKGIYAPPVAELGLAMLLALFRDLTRFVGADSWARQSGRTLHGAHVVIVGGGGIARSFTEMLQPFRCSITIVRRHDQPFDGADRIVTSDRLHDVLPEADVVVLALPLLDENRGLIGATELDLLPDDAVLINVARGGHVDTEALVDALRKGSIAGAGLDVTDPEPLPDGHPLWELPNAIITPHTGNTQEMAVPLFGDLITENVSRWIDGDDLTGTVDPDLGY